MFILKKYKFTVQVGRLGLGYCLLSACDCVYETDSQTDSPRRDVDLVVELFDRFKCK